jgi:CRISPR-associated protein Cas1
MIKRTLYFGNPAYLKLKNEQLEINVPGANGMDRTIGNTIPIEDIGVVIIDHSQITLTHGVIHKLLDNNVALITCNKTHHPAGLMLPLSVNTLQQERFSDQINASEPLKKQLWQQTIKAKIKNQAAMMEIAGFNAQTMRIWSNEVTSGDSLNHEARAAALYWKNLFIPFISEFIRGREEAYPNNLLNYGYAILRATVARGLVGSGLLPTLGIHHSNKYNAYCLADDIMEPYRPMVDQKVYELVKLHKGKELELTKETKQHLLQIPALEVTIEGQRSPLMVGLQRTTSSLAKCYSGESRKLIYPDL